MLPNSIERTGEVERELLTRLEEGRSLRSVCGDDDMPSREAVRLWRADDKDFDLAITRAREDGWEYRAERAVESAKEAKDAGLGRLALDAEKWLIGKMSRRLSDDKIHKHEHEHRAVHRVELVAPGDDGEG